MKSRSLGRTLGEFHLHQIPLLWNFSFTVIGISVRKLIPLTIWPKNDSKVHQTANTNFLSRLLLKLAATRLPVCQDICLIRGGGTPIDIDPERELNEKMNLGELKSRSLKVCKNICPAYFPQTDRWSPYSLMDKLFRNVKNMITYQQWPDGEF